MDANSATTLAAPPDAVALPAAKTPWREAWAGMVSLAAVVATVAMLVRGSSPAGPLATTVYGGGLFLPVLCLLVLVLAAGFDAATGRIPRALTYTAILVGLAVNCAALLLDQAAPRVVTHWLGAAGPTQSVLGLLLFGGIGVTGVLFAGMGGGDMKLLATVGALLGLSGAANVLICGAAVAVIYALIDVLIAGRFSAVFRAAASHLLDWFYLRRWTLPENRCGAGGLKRTIPMAVPLLAGMLLADLPWVASTITWLIRPG